MNISPVTNYNYRALNFRANKSTNPIENENKNNNRSESQQNNGTEIRFDSKAYLMMEFDSMFDKLEEYGVFSKNEDKKLELAPKFDAEHEETSPAEAAADTAIMMIKVSAASLGANTEEAQKAPTFAKFGVQNYLELLENNIKEAKAQLEDIELPNLEDLDEMDEFSQDGTGIDMESVVQQSMAMVPDILETQETMLEVLKTTKTQELEEALDDLSKTTNLLFYKAINHGFNGNARGVVNTLSDNIELRCEPEIEDNEDGTSTYTYTNFNGSKYEITRNNQNGDYINAIQKDIMGNIGFEVEFNPDGSIKRLDFVNEIDKSIVSITQKENRVIARQIFNGLVTERRFIRREDGNLKQTSMQMFMRNN